MFQKISKCEIFLNCEFNIYYLGLQLFSSIGCVFVIIGMDNRTSILRQEKYKESL